MIRHCTRGWYLFSLWLKLFIFAKLLCISFTVIFSHYYILSPIFLFYKHLQHNYIMFIICFHEILLISKIELGLIFTFVVFEGFYFISGVVIVTYNIFCCYNMFNYRLLRKLYKGQNLTLDFGSIKMKTKEFLNS